MLCQDVLIIIINLLSDKEKIMTLSTSKKMHQFKCQFTYHEEIYLERIINLPYFDNFISIKASYVNKYPKHVKHIRFLAHDQKNYAHIPQSVTHIVLENSHGIIILPQSVTHLTLREQFGKHLIIPPSVINLTVEMLFNDLIRVIPSTVKYLTINRFTNYIEKIPEFVSHLTLNNYVGYMHPCDQLFTKWSKVTHLTFGKDFDACISNMIPLSIIEIKLNKKYNHPIDSDIISRVKMIRVE